MEPWLFADVSDSARLSFGSSGSSPSTFASDGG